MNYSRNFIPWYYTFLEIRFSKTQGNVKNSINHTNLIWFKKNNNNNNETTFTHENNSTRSKFRLTSNYEKTPRKPLILRSRIIIIIYFLSKYLLFYNMFAVVCWNSKTFERSFININTLYIIIQNVNRSIIIKLL